MTAAHSPVSASRPLSGLGRLARLRTREQSTLVGWQLDLVTSEDHFQALSTVWDRILERSASRSPFLRWDWISLWWEEMRDRCRLAVGVLRNPLGEPVALAPLVTGSPHKGARRALRQLSFMGGFGSIDSPRQDFIVPEGQEAQMTPRLCKIFATLRGNWDCARLNAIPEESPNLPHVLSALQRFTWGGDILNRHPCRYINLPSDWPAYEMTHSGSWRSKMRRKWKALEREHGGQMGTPGLENPDAAMATLASLHRNRFPEGVSDFLHESSVRFHRKLARRWISSGKAMLTSIEIGGEAAGMIYGFREEDSFFQYQMGWDPRYSELSIGKLAMGGCIREAIAQGVRTYDTLPGEFSYKEGWCPEVRHLVDLEAFHPFNARATVFRVMRALKRRALRARAGRPFPLSSRTY